MKTIITLTAMFLFAFSMNGCGAIAALVVNKGNDKMLDYNISKENQTLLTSMAKDGYRVRLGEFTDASESNETIKCRLMTSVHPPKHETYVQYIQHAFEKEFKASGLYDEHTRTVITATINEIEGSSVYGDAYWSFEVTLRSSNGEKYTVRSEYEYESSITAAYACEEMHKTFPRALQKLIHDAIKDLKFKSLLDQNIKSHR